MAALAATLPSADLALLDAATDSALLWALVRHRLRSGEPAPSALARVVTAVAARTPGRLTVLMLDGRQIVGSVLGEPMVVRELDGGIAVASEPWDDDPAGRALPDITVLTVTTGGLATTPL